MEEVVIEREYEWIDQILTRADPVVIDLGANIGLFSLAAFKLWPGAVVHSLEPDPDTFEVLQRNCSSHQRFRWIAYPCAIWHHSEQVRFTSQSFSTSSRIGSSGDNIISVQTMTLPDLIDNHVRARVNILKMDIEGAEEQVLCSAHETLSRVDHLIVEVHPQLCDEHRVFAALRASYSHLYRIPGRRSTKPLLLAARQPYSFPPA